MGTPRLPRTSHILILICVSVLSLTKATAQGVPAAPASGGAAPVAAPGAAVAIPGAGAINGASNVQNFNGAIQLSGSPQINMSSPDLNALGFGQPNMAINPNVGAGYGTAAMCMYALSAGLTGASLAGLHSTSRWGDDLERQARSPIERDHSVQRDLGSQNVVTIECDKNSKVTMGYNNDEKCTRDKMHKGMAEHMDKVFLGCVQSSAVAAGYPKPESIHINHMGCHHVRTVAGSSTMSLHSWGRALDIGAIILKPSGTKLSMHVRNGVGNNRTFYNSLRACWARSLPPSCRAGSGREAFGSIGYPGSEGPSNGSHNDHLHLSFPPCAGE